MALSLGWHIVIACFGVGMPALVLLAEWRGQRTGDPALPAAGPPLGPARWACSSPSARSPGTILSFEMGMLWPGLMGRSAR